MFNACIFILSYGRARRIPTLNLLKDVEYPIFLICSDDDKDLPIYKERFGEMVKIFNKQKIYEKLKFDLFLNNYKAVVFARNYSYILAKELGYDYFLVLDDDYIAFYKWIGMQRQKINFFTECEKTFKLLANTNAECIAWMQAGDFLGGSVSETRNKIKRKAMNSFFCKTNKPLRFDGVMNEDVNMYISEGLKGKIIFSLPFLFLTQGETQSHSGGLTDIYKELGTFQKSFISKIISPIAVELYDMGAKYKRIHHKINYNACCPKILSERFKKCHD